MVNMHVNVFDSCGMIAYIESEEGVEVIDSLLSDRDNFCIAHAINLAEVYKHYVKHKSVEVADEVIRVLTSELGIAPRNDMDEAFWKLAASNWAKITTTVKNLDTGGCHHISMADCFAIALANRENGTVVTSDVEFEYVEAAGICSVKFYRPPGRRYDH